MEDTSIHDGNTEKQKKMQSASNKEGLVDLRNETSVREIRGYINETGNTHWLLGKLSEAENADSLIDKTPEERKIRFCLLSDAVNNVGLSQEEKKTLSEWITKNEQLLAAGNSDFVDDGKISKPDLEKIYTDGSWPDGRKLSPEDLGMIEKIVSNYLLDARGVLSAEARRGLVNPPIENNNASDILVRVNADGTETKVSPSGVEVTLSGDTMKVKFPPSSMGFKAESEFELNLKDGTGNFKLTHSYLSERDSENYEQFDTSFPITRTSDGTWEFNDANGNTVSFQLSKDNTEISVATPDGFSLESNDGSLNITIDGDTVKADGTKVELNDSGKVITVKAENDRIDVDNELLYEGGLCIIPGKDGSSSIQVRTGGNLKATVNSHGQVEVSNPPGSAEIIIGKNREITVRDTTGTEVQGVVVGGTKQFSLSDGGYIKIQPDGNVEFLDCWNDEDNPAEKHQKLHIFKLPESTQEKSTGGSSKQALSQSDLREKLRKWKEPQEA